MPPASRLKETRWRFVSIGIVRKAVSALDASRAAASAARARPAAGRASPCQRRAIAKASRPGRIWTALVRWPKAIAESSIETDANSRRKERGAPSARCTASSSRGAST
jgi:hypothetical protein